MKNPFSESNVSQCDEDVVRTTHPGHSQRPPGPEPRRPGRRHLIGGLVATPSPGSSWVACKSLCPMAVSAWDGAL